MNCSLHNKAQQKTEEYRPDTQTDRDADRETDREKLFLNALNRWRFSGQDPPPIHRYSTFFHSLLYYLMRSGADSNEYQSALDYLTRNEVIWSEPPWSEHCETMWNHTLMQYMYIVHRGRPPCVHRRRAPSQQTRLLGGCGLSSRAFTEELSATRFYCRPARLVI